MAESQVLLEEMSWPAIRMVAEKKPCIIIPTGSIEQHGPHLPLLVDALIAQKIAQAAAIRACGQIPVLVAPTMALGLSEEHLDFAGTLSLKPITFMNSATEEVFSLIHHGFDRFLFLNSHGGNLDALKLVARILRQEHGVLVAVTSYWQIAHAKIHSIRQTPGGGVNHGGEEETSIMLYLRPDLVDMSAASSNPLRWRSSYLSGGYLKEPQVNYGRLRRDIAPLGHNGDPTLASADKGRQLFDGIADAVARFLEDFYSWRLDEMVAPPENK